MKKYNHHNITKVIIVTSNNEIANYQILEVMGEVFGEMTLSINEISPMRTKFFEGEIPFYTKFQQETIDILKEKAILKGANAIIDVRFDSYTFTKFVSVAAYGTAVKIEKK